MPFEQHYPWTRYWAPRDKMSLFADTTFAPDPGRLVAIGWPMHELSALRHVPLLVLLGQPGQGKSTAIDAEIESLRAEGTATEKVDLAGVDSGILLKDDLRSSAALALWRDGAELHLFVDGLDRAQVGLRTLQHVLQKELDASASAAARLRVRIACRSADWEDGVAERLGGLWDTPDSEPTFLLVELLNLTYGGFEIAAQAHNLDPAEVARELAAKGATSMAAVPMTLAMILEAFTEDGVLGTRTELYERACGRLVANAVRAQDQRPADVLPLAARQAAGLLQCDGAGLVAADRSTRSEITIFDLAGGTEPAFNTNDPAVVVERQPLLDLHNTALMRSTAGRATFVHQTYAEYLCARWLASGRLAPEQISALLVNPYDTRGELLPHLRDVAGWLAAMNPDVFGWLLSTHARVLLRGDLAQLEPDARAAIVRVLLLPSDEPVRVWDPQVRSSLGRLRHPGLASQLSGPLTRRDTDEDVVLVAITLAHTNRVRELADALLALASDREAQIVLRHAATSALGDVGDSVHLDALRPLAVELQDEDRADEVKGAALAVLWPEHIDTAALLDALAPARRNNFYGNYQSFLSRAASDVPVDDLAAAIRWAARQPRAPFATDALSEFTDSVVERAWPLIADDAIADALTELAVVRLRHNREIANSSVRRNDSEAFKTPLGRRVIVQRLIPHLGESGLHPIYLQLSRPPLVQPDDLAWLCDAFQLAPTSGLRAKWASLIDVAFSPEQSPAMVNAILESAHTHGELADALSFWIGSVELDSEQARLGREQLARVFPAPAEPQHDTPESTDIDIDAEIQRFLGDGERGDLDAWWWISHLMIFDQAGKPETFESDPQLSNSPGWKRADAATRARLIELAATYVRRRGPRPSKWWGKSTLWRPANAGVQALVVLHQHGHPVWKSLSKKRWDVWCPAVVGFGLTGPEGAEALAPILRRLANDVPETLAAWLVRAIRLDDGTKTVALLQSRLPVVLPTPEVESALLQVAQDETVSAALRAELLSICVQEGVGIGVATSILQRAVDPPTADEELASGLLSTLLQHAPVATWAVAWPIIEAIPTVGRRVIESLATFESYGVAADLTADQVADLYLWLEEQYPRSEDPDDNDGIISTRQQIGWWRDRLVEVLIQRRTDASVAALRRLHLAMPQVKILALRLRAAEVALAQDRWTPPRPRELVLLAEDRVRRLVQSAEQLQRVVLESLTRANERLQSEWPKAWQLWNDAPLKPKSEERLSDWIKDWLDDDLARRLVTTREPQVRATRSGSGIGARNDLRVEVAADNERGALATIIEVKRYWHPKVTTAARTQLADDYLATAGLTHGIYLVGFYGAPGWAGAGTAITRRRSLEEWRNEVAQIASRASRETGRVIAPFVIDVSLRSDRAS
jgi:hypothetical protein